MTDIVGQPRRTAYRCRGADDLCDACENPQDGPTCPGCGFVLYGPNDCMHCEYFNLLVGRNHYCGKDSCYCRNLRGLMFREVLETFAQPAVAGETRETHTEPSTKEAAA